MVEIIITITLEIIIIISMEIITIQMEIITITMEIRKSVRFYGCRGWRKLLWWKSPIKVEKSPSYIADPTLAPILKT